MVWRGSLLAALGLLLGTTAVADAKALSEEQRNALNHMAQVQVAADLCRRVEVNKVAILLLVKMYDLDFADPEVSEYLLLRYRAQMEPMRGKDEDMICRAGLFLYGPNGENVKDMLTTK